MSFEIVNPPDWPPPRGWNHGMLAPAGGRLLFVAGQTASDDSGTVPLTDFVTQFEQALGKVVTVVRQAGGEPEHIGRFTIYVTDRLAYLAGREAMGEAYRRLMGRHYPAMALVQVLALVDANAMIEIEATAVLPA